MVRGIYPNGNKGLFKKGNKINLGKKNTLGKHWKIKRPSWKPMLGKHHSEETKKKIKEGNIGKHSKGNKCKVRQERNDSLYVWWVSQIKKRDKNICKLKDGNCSGYNIVHHILSWSTYPDLRYKIDNGITLCRFHHPKKRKNEIKLIPILMELVRQKQ